MSVVDEAIRSEKSYDKDSPFRLSLLSAEGEFADEIDIVTFARDHRDSFLRLVGALTPERRRIAIEYLVLRKTEKQIATLHGLKSQGMLSQEIKSIVRLLGATIALGKCPTLDEIRSILAQEKITGCHADAIAAYADAGNLTQASRALTRSGIRMTRAEIRRHMREVVAPLMRSKSLRSQACGEYVKGLIAQWNCSHRPRKRFFADPAVLGNFEVDIANRKARFVFASRAGQVSNASHL